MSLDEIFGILDVQEHLGHRADAIELAEVRATVSFEDVHFRYEQPQRPLLAGMTCMPPPGETIAIVGPSGSGKTTMMALLMRFYDPVEAESRSTGAICALKQSSLRRQIGIVLQDPLLFNDSRKANIAYGRPEATEAEIEAAAKPRTPMSSSCGSRKDTRRASASAALCCRSVSASASRSRERCSRIRAS